MSAQESCDLAKQLLFCASEEINLFLVRASKLTVLHLNSTTATTAIATARAMVPSSRRVTLLPNGPAWKVIQAQPGDEKDTSKMFDINQYSGEHLKKRHSEPRRAFQIQVQAGENDLGKS